jgi:hypothetical protein
LANHSRSANDSNLVFFHADYLLSPRLKGYSGGLKIMRRQKFTVLLD